MSAFLFFKRGDGRRKNVVGRCGFIFTEEERTEGSSHKQQAKMTRKVCRANFPPWRLSQCFSNSLSLSFTLPFTWYFGRERGMEPHIFFAGPFLFDQAQSL